MLRAFRWTQGKLSAPTREEIPGLAGAEGLLWVDLEAPSAEEIELFRRLGSGHPLAVEDCLADSKIPKLNVHGDLVHLVIHGSSPPSAGGELRTRELDLLWGPHLLVTYHAHPLRSVNALRDRCEREPGTILGRGPAWTLHGILDVLVDNWFPFLEAASTQLASFEKRLLKGPGPAALGGLNAFSHRITTLLGIVARQRAVFERLSREETPFVGPELRPYFRDLQDRAVVLHMELELQREQVRSVREGHLMTISNNLNQIMKTLTVVSTVLMSVSVVTGIYGMNFRNMPELGWRWGYPMALGVMGLAGLGVWLWIRRKGWS